MSERELRDPCFAALIADSLTVAGICGGEVHVGVLVILEMDGDTDALLAAAADLENRRPTRAMLARVIAPTEGGAVVCTFWESAEAREQYQSQPEHGEALRTSGLLDATTDMRSRVFDDAELTTQ